MKILQYPLNKQYFYFFLGSSAQKMNKRIRVCTDFTILFRGHIIFYGQQVGQSLTNLAFFSSAFQVREHNIHRYPTRPKSLKRYLY